MSRLSRRRFLHAAAAGFSAATIAGSLPASDKKASASERLRVGVVGVAGQGAYNLGNVAHEEIVALCDVDENRAGAARQAHPQAKFYQDFGIGRSRGTLTIQLAGNVKYGGLVEKAFGIRLVTRDVRSMKNVGDMIRLIKIKTTPR